MNHKYEVVKVFSTERLKMTFDTNTIFGEMQGSWNLTLRGDGSIRQGIAVFTPVIPFLQPIEDPGGTDRIFWLKEVEIRFNHFDGQRARVCLLAFNKFERDGAEPEYRYAFPVLKHGLVNELEQISQQVAPIVCDEFFYNALIMQLERDSFLLTKRTAKQLAQYQALVKTNRAVLTIRNLQVV